MMTALIGLVYGFSHVLRAYRYLMCGCASTAVLVGSAWLIL